MSINKVILVGRTGKDPEVRYLENGTVAANFTLATSEKYTDKAGQKQEITEWHNVSVFGKLAEIVEKYVTKGTLLYIEGQIKTRSWDDKEGNKRYTTEIVLNGFNSTIKMLGGKSDSQLENDLPY